jgi:hypothetical protein
VKIEGCGRDRGKAIQDNRSEWDGCKSRPRHADVESKSKSERCAKEFNYDVDLE